MPAKSLQARLFWAAMVALAAFLTLTGVALEQAYTQSAIAALHDRLQSYIWAYLSGSDVSVAGTLILPEFPPDPRFERPQSGLYAAVFGNKINWQSGSSLELKLPWAPQLKPNEERFVGPMASAAGPVYVLSQGVSWEVPKLGPIELTFNVAESTQGLQQQIEVFRRTLWVYLGAAGVALLALEIVMLRLGLKPLRRVARDLEEIERGAADRLSGPYPRELESLTQTLNDFIESEREHRERYRHTLADLAHSLKTPLAVARAELEGEKQGAGLNAALASQLHRMDEIVAYQLSRPATSGHKIMAKPLAIEARAEQIVKSLEMLHADRGVVCEFDFDPAARFFGEEGDLMELLGNLLENAFKWANRRVSLSAEALTPRRARRPGLRLVVADDGPGVPEDEVDVLGHRGVRGDERVQGHGIGLAIVHDLLAAYRGRLTISRSEALGGACFTVTLPPMM